MLLALTSPVQWDAKPCQYSISKRNRKFSSRALSVHKTEQECFPYVRSTFFLYLILELKEKERKKKIPNLSLHKGSVEE